jgi:CBS-domain-containing membrane protein
LSRPNPPEELQLTLDSPALALFTDFTRTQAVSVPGTTQIDEALQQMIVVGVRLLFVTDAEFQLIGGITSYDIAGEKPMMYLQSRNAPLHTSESRVSSRAAIQVHHIMRPLAAWHVLDYQTLLHLRIGDVVETFKTAGQQHIVVIEGSGSALQVRGILSARQFQRALGINMDIWQRSNSFAEIERAVAHPRLTRII